MPTDPRDYKVEISGMASEQPSAAPSGKPYLSIHFTCCGVYCRIYRNAEGSAYIGHCPRCAKPVRFVIADGGTNERFFKVE